MSEDIRTQRAAYRHFAASNGERHPGTLSTRINLVISLTEVRRLAEARKEGEFLMPLLREALGPDHPRMADGLLAYGEVLLLSNEAERALGAFREANRIREKAFGPGNLKLANGHASIGEALIALGRPAEAIKEIEVGLITEEKAGLSPGERAETELLLAEALVLGRRALPRATALWRRAQPHLRTSRTKEVVDRLTRLGVALKQAPSTK